MKWIKKVLALTLAVGLVCCMIVSASAGFYTSATSTCVMDVDSGRVLFEENAHEQRPIASITKIMTGLLACEYSNEGNLKTVLTCSETANAEQGSSLYMEVGNKITLESCIYGTMLRSGNDAAMLLAETVAGDKDSFVAMMNEKAQEIGMSDTLYGNPNGLIDEGNYSTAYDMCLLGCYAMQNELFAKVVNTWYIETEDGWEIENHNKLLSMDERCIGIKTGFTSAAGRTLVSCFQDPDSGQRIVVCTLNDSDDFQEHIGAHNWAFESYPTRTLCQEGKTVTTFTMAGTGEVWNLTASQSVTYPLSDDETREITAQLVLPDNQAELAEGEAAGHIIYFFQGEEIGRADLICGAHE